MKKPFTFLIVLVLFSLSVFGQESTTKYEFRIGTGVALWPKNNLEMSTFIAETDYRFHDYFALNVGLGFNGGSDQKWGDVRYYHLNTVLAISPFKNTSRHHVRLGVGSSIASLRDRTLISGSSNSDGVFTGTYENIRTWDIGLYANVDYHYAIKNKYTIGVRGMAQIYDFALISGIMIMFGYRL